MALAIETENLTKRFGSLTAVDKLNLRVEESDIFGFLGPNGAGKTTTIRMMMGFIRPNGGDVKIFGEPLSNGKEARMNIGYLPEEFELYGAMTAYENLDFFARLYGIKEGRKDRIGELFSLVGLEGEEKKRVRNYSHGMRRRLGIAQALINDPKLLILDEPTMGLDPKGSRDVRDLLKELKKRDATIFLSSHLLYEVQEICNKVGIINRGRLLEIDTIVNLQKRVGGEGNILEVELVEVDNKMVRVLKKLKGVRSVKVEGNILRIGVENFDITPDINSKIVSLDGKVKKMREVTPDLEEIFLKITEA
jgi:ABC-2 type transport system ATP-binding protein